MPVECDTMLFLVFQGSSFPLRYQFLSSDSGVKNCVTLKIALLFGSLETFEGLALARFRIDFIFWAVRVALGVSPLLISLSSFSMYLPSS
jgi:hypothetical protein